MVPTKLARPRWDRGEREAAHAAWRNRLLAGLLLVLMASVVLAGFLVLAPGRVALLGGAQAGREPEHAPPPTPDPAPPPSLTEVPATRFALAFLELDDPLVRATDALGPPDRQQPDISGSQAYTWSIGGGATVDVIADEHGIFGLGARVPAGSTSQVAVYGGVLIGASTPRDVVAAWGDAHQESQHAGDDFAVSYTECRDAFPVVVKFDHDRAEPGVDWDAPITRVFISYADADPGAHGCAAAHEA